ncbi:MAG: MarR family transcriptional regulator [Planctomycetia bacterium]|nr:MarR family transcriptional regulator [Planctomycetia bacterium]
MDRGHEIAMGLRRAYWAMHRQADAQFAKGGVTADQFVLLSILAEGDQITQQELGRRASSDPNTIRAMLVLLEKQGLVARRPHPTDGRARSVTLTTKGRKTYQRLWKISDLMRQQIAALFKQSEITALLDGLSRIAER